MIRLSTSDPAFEAGFAALLDQSRETTEQVDQAVAGIIADVRARGDAALLDYTARFDRLTLDAAQLRVTAVEIDHRLAERLPATAASHGVAEGALTVVDADALRVTALPGDPNVLVANLPYNVSVPVLLHFMETFPGLERGVVMVQAEVGERLAAPPGSKVYGAPSVKAASISAPSQRSRPLRISADAPSSSTITAAASGAAGARPKCVISAMAPSKSKALTRPPCR